MQYDIWGHTDRGRRRRENQDAILFSTLARDVDLPMLGVTPEGVAQAGRLVAVADGVGGVRGGREASRLLIDALAQGYYRSEAHASVGDYLRTAIARANAEAVAKNQHENASTTLVAAVAHDDKLHVAHVGDSRAYLIRNGKMQQLTEDHSLGNRLTRYLVSTTEFEATLHPPLALRPGDRVLLCSDGLFRPISDLIEIIPILQKYCAEEAAARLIGLANAGGGHDNISVVLIHVNASLSRPRPKWDSV